MQPDVLQTLFSLRTKQISSFTVLLGLVLGLLGLVLGLVGLVLGLLGLVLGLLGLLGLVLGGLVLRWLPPTKLLPLLPLCWLLVVISGVVCVLWGGVAGFPMVLGVEGTFVFVLMFSK